jgi:SAF domain
MDTRSPAPHLAQASADDGRGPRPLRVAPARRQRRPAIVLVGLLLILVGAAVTAQLFLQVGGRTAVLAVARPVTAGHPITGQDLTEVRISVDPALRAVPASERSRVVGQVATVDLLPRSLLTREALATASIPGAGQAIVGVALKAGQMPSALKAGDHVMLVLTPPAGSGGTAAAAGPTGRVLVEDAEVFDLRQAETDQATVASVVVARGEAADVARAQATGQVSLVLVAAPS